MWWRIKRSEFEKEKGEGNKNAMKALVRSGTIPEILAYDGKKPVAWCSVAPREEFSVLARSRILAPLDDLSVWSVVRFFVEKDYRNKGVTVQLLETAIEYVKENGGKIVEGYPIEPKKKPWPAVFKFIRLVPVISTGNFAVTFFHDLCHNGAP